MTRTAPKARLVGVGSMTGELSKGAATGVCDRWRIHGAPREGLSNARALKTTGRIERRRLRASAGTDARSRRLDRGDQPARSGASQSMSYRWTQPNIFSGFMKVCVATGISSVMRVVAIGPMAFWLLVFIA